MEVRVNKNIALEELINIRTQKNIKVKENNYIQMKRGLDIIISIIALIILLPVFIIIICAIKLESKGSVIFKHKRIGKKGKNIEIYKFRTMIENAEEMINNFSIEQLEEFQQNFKLKNDPRITKVGKFLRKTSLDELPQLLNILKGDMSLIGPRPIVQDELDKYCTNKAKFLSVTPGLTGNWAANGRSCTSYEERMKLELDYIDNLNLKTDIKVFFKTIITVLKGRGAV